MGQPTQPGNQEADRQQRKKAALIGVRRKDPHFCNALLPYTIHI
jgi:hypothetical protein